MVTVRLHNLIFSGHHGVFKEELATGNTFEVHLDVIYDEKDRPFENLDSIVNYVNLFAIVKQRMHQPSPLLEKIADEIIGKIKALYPFIREVIISIYKLQAPIGNFQGKAGMTLHKKFDS
ncbi:MAG: dihydroneopterin aldolase [Chitinophagaceae bacterium]|nr:dihydroneopterin aldolase [Chitinophagaceae bacterium]